MDYYSKSVREVLDALHTDGKLGLDEAEAARRLAEYGKNQLAEKKKKSLIVRFFGQFKDVMIMILLAAAGVSFAVACAEGNPMEFIEPALILLIVILNAVMGLVQENRAEKALEALVNMSAPHARVIRDGKEKKVEVVFKSTMVDNGSVDEDGAVAFYGAKIKEADKEKLAALGLDRGVEIVSVGPGKIMDAGVSEGFVILYVNDQPVSKPQDVMSIVKKTKRAVFIEGVTSYGKPSYFGFGVE